MWEAQGKVTALVPFTFSSSLSQLIVSKLSAVLMPKSYECSMRSCKGLTLEVEILKIHLNQTNAHTCSASAFVYNECHVWDQQTDMVTWQLL